MNSNRMVAAVHREILRLAYRGLDSRTLRLETIRHLRRVMPIDSFWMATADPMTFLFTSAVKEEIPGSAIPHFVTNELLQDDVNKFRALVLTSKAPAETLYRATEDRPESSRRFREILRPLGFGDELRAVFCTGGVPWGYACLHCEPGAGGYVPAHLRLLEEIGPHLAQGLRAALLLRAVEAGETALEERPGLVVLAPDLSIAAASPEGERWLAELDEVAPRKELPQAVHSVAVQLRAFERDGKQSCDVGPPRIRVRTASGRWLTLHASRLAGPYGADQTAVILEPARPHEIAPLLLGAYGLTRREAEVTQLVMRGLATDGIAAALSISPLTVQQHLKSIFDKTGVGSRRELTARLFARHYQPHEA